MGLALVSAEDKTEEQAVAPVADQETAAGHYGYWGYPAWGHRYGYYPGHHYGWTRPLRLRLQHARLVRPRRPPPPFGRRPRSRRAQTQTLPRKGSLRPIWSFRGGCRGAYRHGCRRNR